MKKIYAALCVLGTLLPYYFFVPYVASNGLDLSRFLGDLFANGASATFAADILVSSLVLWVFIYGETRRRPVRFWWLAVVANLLVGLSLGLPLFLLLREYAQEWTPGASAPVLSTYST